jgi:hypothetical protein
MADPAIENMTGSSYKRTSTAVLIIALAGLTLPLLYPLIAKGGAILQCPSLTVFKNPCPLCGLTRGFFHIWHLRLAEATRLNILAIPLFLLMAGEVIFRAFMLLALRKKPELSRFSGLDARVHLTLFTIYVIYSLGFVVLRWKFTL